MSSAGARALHERSIVIDALDVSLPVREHFEHMRAGGVTAANYTITLADGFDFRRTVQEIRAFDHRLEQNADILRSVRSVGDIEAAKRERRVGIIYGFQNATPIERDLRLVEVFARLGVRIIQLTYMTANLLGDGCLEPRNAGLTYFGREVVREIFLTPQFWDDSSYFARYSWPVEYVVQAIKDVGWVGFSVDDARAALSAMGQDLFEPPDVNGWVGGQTWFSSGAMLARMNFASLLAANQRFNLAVRSKPAATTPESFLAFFLDAFRSPPIDSRTRADLLNYLQANGSWTATDAQIQAKSVGLVHLIAASPEYQFV